MELSQFKGVGKTRLQALHAAGICSLRELLYTVPVKYKDLGKITPIAEAEPGTRVTMHLVREGEAKLSRHGKLSRVTCNFADDTGKVSAVWFNQPYMRNVLNNGTRFTFHGLMEAHGRGRKLMNASIEKELRIIPVYKPIEGLPQKTHENLVMQALAYAEEVCAETLPQEIIEKYQLCSCVWAIRALHAPSSMEEVARAQRRFAFEQMLLYQAAVRMMKDVRKEGYPVSADEEAQKTFWNALPFEPTKAQRRTLQEIAKDLSGPNAMARMVQGDVGSGKTAVAMGAMLLCAQAGYQCALMAPTEILARQHYDGMKDFFEQRGFGCGLLLGSMTAKERKEAKHKLETGEWRIAIGTHALISKGVVYQNLGLCVTDEQHRFGVAQRTALINKGADERRSPHLLVMSATPIPRSLALVMFGDLDISIMDELPPGRLPVTTRIVSEDKREGMYGFLKKELDEGRQAYIVCSLVDESETSDELKAAKSHAEELQEGILQNYRVGLTYGNQPAKEKEEALHAFAAGETQVLVATTVIEVGVNVPNASLMIIEDADRYGLAQLHQLRGRVGRGTAQSWCFLMAQANDRLRTLVRTNDGFEVARADLEQRGPGELLGTRQHGEALIPGGAAAFGSMQLLYEAAHCAEELQADLSKREVWRAIAAQAVQLVGRLSDRVSIS